MLLNCLPGVHRAEHPPLAALDVGQERRRVREVVDAVEPHAVLSRLEAVLPLAARAEARNALQVVGREVAVVLDEQRRTLELRLTESVYILESCHHSSQIF